LHLSAGEPDRCVIIDAREPQAAVAARIWDTVAKRLDPATAPVTLEDVAS
jgi:thymidylate kinase